MKMPARKIDLNRVLNQTCVNQDYVKQALTEDSDRVARLEKQQCRACHYMRGKIGGAACTEKPCDNCGAAMHFGNTCTDALCLACARKMRLCKFCGGDIEDRNRRKL